MYYIIIFINKHDQFLIGSGYVQSSERDILLLDISNNDEYIWTNTFGLQPPSSPQSPSTTTSVPSSLSSNNEAAMISTAIGGSFLLAVMCFFLYKWKKNKQAQKNVVPNPGREEGM